MTTADIDENSKLNNQVDGPSPNSNYEPGIPRHTNKGMFRFLLFFSKSILILILDDLYTKRRALSPVDSDFDMEISAKPLTCELLVHFEDYSGSLREMTVTSDIAWNDFQQELAETLEIPTKKFREMANITYNRGGASVRGKGVAISDANRFTEILKHIRDQKLQTTAKGKQKSIDPTIPNIYIKITNLKVRISHFVLPKLLTIYTDHIPSICTNSRLTTFG